jgi:putative oxidoreductase
MERYLGRYSGEIYALARIVAGFLFACHGAQKLFGVLGGQQAGTALIWTAGVIEFLGGVLVALGLGAGWAAFVASGQMAVAYFLAHQSRGLLLPIQNEGELAALYSFVFLLIASRGSGMWSLDVALGRSRSR